MDKSKINTELSKWYKWFNVGSKQWSFVYHLCLYGTLILTLSIGALNSFGDFEVFKLSKSNLTAILAFLAALFSSMIIRGGLDKKWRSNRISRGKIQSLQIDMLDDTIDLTIIAKELKKIISEHDNSITDASLYSKDI